MDERQTEMALLPPRVEDQELSPRSQPGQGLDVEEFARDSFLSAMERFQSAGNVDVDPNDSDLYNAYRRSVDYLGDMALGGLDLSDAAFRAAVGIAAQALPEDQERRFARDLAGMPEAFLGVSPGRIAAATDEVMEGVAQVGRNLTRRDEMPTLGSNLGNLAAAGGQPARTPQPLFREADPLQRFGGNTVANFYSPVNQVIEEANFPKRGMRGADVERLLRDSDLVRNSEVSALELSSRLNPQQRYTREEVLREIEPLQFNVRADRVAEFDEDGNYPNFYSQRQEIDDPEDEYHETIIRASRNGSGLNTFRSAAGTHYTTDTIAHLRTSTRFGPNNEKYYLVEEIQSDLVARGAARPGPARSEVEGLREHFDSVIFPEMQRRYKNNPDTAPIVDGTQDDWFRLYQRSAAGFNTTLDLGLTGEDADKLSIFSNRMSALSENNSDARRAISAISEGIERDAFYTSTNMDEILRPTSPAPIKDINEVVRIALQTAISDAIQSGANSVVIPNLERIVSSGRARPGTEDFDRMTSEGSSFYRTYVTGLNNALEEIKRDLPDIEVSEVDLPYNRYTRNDILLDEGDDGSDLLSSIPDGEEILPTNATRIDISAYAGSNLNELRFAEGGAVTMERQMSLFEEGGLRDDGTRMDPVSGNEVPPGSMAREVRDDVPAQLSEGEYIVPADVVRYYGVKFFEDLRTGAKQGLSSMEQNGRIGGEPVGVPGEEPLSPEEMQMLAEISGMYQGGQVKKGYNNGGIELPNIGFDYMTPGSSITNPSGTTLTYGTTQQQDAAEEETRTVNLFAPDGTMVPLILPAEQEKYDTLIAQGYTTEQNVVAQNAAQAGNDGDNSDSRVDQGDSEGNFSSWAENNYEALSNDPVQFGKDLLENAIGRGTQRAAGTVAGMINPALGIVAGGISAGYQADIYARALASADIARRQGNTSGADELEALAEDYYENKMNGFGRAAVDFAQNILGIELGSRYSDRFFELDPATITTPTNVPVTRTPGVTRAPGITPVPSGEPFYKGVSAESLLPPSPSDFTPGEITYGGNYSDPSKGGQSDSGGGMGVQKDYSGTGGGTKSTPNTSSSSSGKSTTSSSSGKSTTSSSSSKGTTSSSSSKGTSSSGKSQPEDKGFGKAEGGLIQRPKKKTTRKSRK